MKQFSDSTNFLAKIIIKSYEESTRLDFKAYPLSLLWNSLCALIYSILVAFYRLWWMKEVICNKRLLFFVFLARFVCVILKIPTKNKKLPLKRVLLFLIANYSYLTFLFESITNRYSNSKIETQKFNHIIQSKF